MSMGQLRSEQKSFFYLIICFILLLHGAIFLVITESHDDKKDEAQFRKLTIQLNPKKRITHQIVRSEDSQNRSQREKAFLSDKTRSFERQSKAKNTDVFSTTKSSGQGKEGSKKWGLADLGSGLVQDPFLKAAKKNQNNKSPETGSKATQGIHSTNDHLSDIPLGDLTQLNTVEYKYYGFYHRIRQKLEQFWGRSIHSKAAQMARNGRQLALSDEFITALRITLDREGEIIAIRILGASGIRELDDAAVESFNEAGPFPNPPKDLLVDGKVTLEWNFVVRS